MSESRNRLHPPGSSHFRLDYLNPWLQGVESLLRELAQPLTESGGGPKSAAGVAIGVLLGSESSSLEPPQAPTRCVGMCGDLTRAIDAITHGLPELVPARARPSRNTPSVRVGPPLNENPRFN